MYSIVGPIPGITEVPDFSEISPIMIGVLGILYIIMIMTRIAEHVYNRKLKIHQAADPNFQAHFDKQEMLSNRSADPVLII